MSERGVQRTRRSLLVAGGATAIASLAGCTGDDDDEGEGSEQARVTTHDPADGVLLNDVSLVNFDDEERTLHLLLEHDGETIHWDGHDLGATGSGDPRHGVTYDDPGTPGEITVQARVGDQSIDTTLDDLEGVCVGLQIVFDPGAETELDIYRSIRDCPERFAE